METLVYRSGFSPVHDTTDEDNTSHSPEQKRQHFDPEYLVMDVDTSDIPVPDSKGYVSNLENSVTSDDAHAPHPNPEMYYSKPACSLQAEDWLEFSKLFSVDSEFHRACKYVDRHLASNGMFLLDDKFRSCPDCRLCRALHSTGEKWKMVLQSNQYKYLTYFFRSVKSEQNRAVTLDIRSPGVLRSAKDGEVCLRLSIKPFPCLDLQYARLALLLDYYTKRYRGRLIIHFDDIDPNMGSIKSEASLLEDLQTLGIRYNAVRHTSDYISQLVEKAESLICQGKAYVDDTSQENIQKEVMNGVESKCRTHSVEKNMELWKEMIAGSNVGSRCCLRGKLDMQSPIKYLRDPVYCYCNSVVSYRTGAKFKLFPTFDFSCPYIDATEGVTHAIRLDYHSERYHLYSRLVKDMGFPRINIILFKMLKMVYTPSTTRQLRWFVDNKIVDGWDDPPLPTVRALVRRGVMIDVLKQFIYEQGVSKTYLIEWDRLWNMNYERLHRNYPIHTAILDQNRVLLTLNFLPGVMEEDKQVTTTICGRSKAVTYSKRIWLEMADSSTFSVGDEVSLLSWGSVVIKEVNTNLDGTVDSLTGVLKGGRSLKSKLWLPARDDLVRLSLIKFEYLTKEKEVEEARVDFQDCQTSTKKELLAWGESDMRNLKRGDIRLLPYKGFYRCDSPPDSDPIVLYHIPTGTM